MKKNIVFLGVLAGIIGGLLIIFKNDNEQYILKEILLIVSILIPLLTTITPQYLFAQKYEKAKFSHIFFIGFIAIVFMLITLVIIDPSARSRLFINVGESMGQFLFAAVVSSITSLIVRYIANKNKASSEVLDDLDY